MLLLVPISSDCSGLLQPKAVGVSEEQPGPASCRRTVAWHLLGGIGSFLQPHRAGSVVRQEGLGLLLLWGSCGRGDWGTAPERLGLHRGERKSTFQGWGGGKRREQLTFSHPSKETRLTSPTFDLLQLQRKPGSRTRVWFSAQK